MESVDNEGIVFHWDTVGTYSIERQNQVVCKGYQGCETDYFLQPFYSVVPSALLTLHGCYTLHANSILIDGVPVVLAGAKGAGKSTISCALLQRKDHSLIADDVTAIDPDQSVIQFRSGAPVLKLWKSTCKLLDIGDRHLKQINPEIEKYYYHINNSASESIFHCSPSRLPIIFFLQSGTGAPEIKRISPMEANKYTLSCHTLANRPEAIHPLTHARLFRQANKMAASLCMYTLTYPHSNRASIEKTCDLIELLVRQS